MKQRLAIAYVCLVGVPLLALVGILRAGRHLHAPRAVAGSYVSGMSLPACPAGSPLTISQSGPNLRAAWGAAALAGSISGESLVLTGSCGGSHALRLVAQVSSGTLNGTLYSDGAPLAFRARLAPRSAR